MQRGNRLIFRTAFAITIVLACYLPMVGCSRNVDRSRGVYMLVDTSGTYVTELDKARTIINYLLGTLQSGDTLAVGRIDTGSFSEKDIVAKVTFDSRPSMANNQKRAFQKKVNDFIGKVERSEYTDISGGILQATEYLNEAGSAKKYILIFSDLREELAKNHVRDVPFQLKGFEVIALNVTKLPEDIRDPKKYMQRKKQWKKKTEEGSGQWQVINDLDRLDHIFTK